MEHRSPLDNIFNIIGALPQGHDKPVKHALYNAVAIFLLFVCCGAAYALHMILEPFVKPLIWALLVGSVLHPIKHRIAKKFQSWFEALDYSKTPVTLGIMMSPFHIINNLSEFIGGQLLSRIKIILAIVITLPLVHVIYNYTPRLIMTLIWEIGVFAYKLITLMVGNITLLVLSTILIAYAIVLFMFWKPENNKVFHYLAISIWVSIICYLSNLVGSLQMPLFLLLNLILLAGFVLELLNIKEELNLSGHDLSIIEAVKYSIYGEKPPLEISAISADQKNEQITELLQPKLCAKEDEAEDTAEHESGDKSDPKTSLIKKEKDPWALELFEEPIPKHKSDLTKKVPLNSAGLLITDKGKIHVVQPANTSSEIFNSSSNIPKVKRSLSQPYVTGKPTSSIFNLKKRSNIRYSLTNYKVINTEEYASYYYMYALGWACGIMIFWKHMWLMPILPIPILFYLFKHIGYYLGLWRWVGNQYNKLESYCSDWLNDRYDAVVPVPVRGILKFFVKLDSYIKTNLKESIDTVASSVVIIGLIVFVTCASIFILVQVYAEAIMLVQMTSNVINQTVVHNPELRQLLPETFDDTVDSILDNAYQYGREGISKAIRGMMSEVDSAKSEKLEKQVLELWDRIYQAWMTSESASGPKVTSNAVQSSWDAFLDDIQKSPELFNINGIVDFVKQNIGMLMSLLESVWAIVKGNISLVIGSFSAIVSVLLGGGTAVLNFILNMIIFLTTLFYLLSSSGTYYKPVEIMTNFSTSGNRFGLALEDAINGVFKASFKMAAFYGLWTWFIHNLFGVKIVYLPSAFAFILGAAPFLGTYWACIPAVLDLWLAQDKGLFAILFFAFQFMPTSVVDTAIYAEIKGGGHPYLTGLAIAGGIFCLGLEGAIIGPLVLCGLYVAMDLSTTLFKESPSEEALNIQQLSRLELGP